jgi:GNAT superfamily N-acetyltransferase
MKSLIRVASLADVPAMTRLLGELFSIESDFQPDTERQATGLGLLLKDPHARAWVVDMKGQVIGMMTLQILISTAEGGRVGLIEDVIITRAWRGRGLGKALLAEAADWAARHGLSRLQLVADRDNETALRFYRGMGWRKTRLEVFRRHPSLSV